MTLAGSSTSPRIIVGAVGCTTTSTSSQQRDDLEATTCTPTVSTSAATITTTAAPTAAAMPFQQNGWFRSVTPIVSVADSPLLAVPLRCEEDKAPHFDEEVQRQQEEEEEEEEGEELSSASSSSAGSSRTGSPSSTLTASSTDGTTVTNSNKKRAQFDTTVSVKVIPSRHDYSSDVKRAIWSDKKECKETKLRNMKEFAKEGYDWRNAGCSSSSTSTSTSCEEPSKNDAPILRPKAMHPYRDVGTYLVNDIELVSRPPCPCPILDDDDEGGDEEDEDDDFIVEAVEEVVNFVVDKDNFPFSFSDPVMRPPCPCPSAMNGDGKTTSYDLGYLDHDAYVATIMMHLNLPKPIPMRCNPIAIDDPLYINGNVEEDDYPLLDGDEEDYESSSADACIFSIEDVLNIYDGKYDDHQKNNHNNDYYRYHHHHHPNHCFYDAPPPPPPPACVIIPAVPVYHHHPYPTTTMMAAAALDG